LLSLFSMMCQPLLLFPVNSYGLFIITNQ
jgi:hypothetical protein